MAALVPNSFFVTTSKALVTSSDALVPSSVLVVNMALGAGTRPLEMALPTIGWL